MDQTIDEDRRLSPSTFAGMTVMVVEDDEHTREGLRLRLEANQARVVCCASGSEALARLRDGERPDLIVLDLTMPDMDGSRFRIEQKQHPEWAAIPVIALSGERAPRAETVDATAYLSKPVAAQTLLETVERVTRDLERSRSLAQASELERLVSLGALLGGIAHEVNNPLAFVFGGIDLLQRQLLSLACPSQAPEPFSVAAALRSLERLKTGAERIAAVVRSASMFASADLSCIEAIDVHEVLEASIQVASNEIRHGAHLVRSYEDVPHVQGNPAKLGQVFLNLLLHAVHAIRDDGGHDHVIRIGTALEQDAVVISVSDSATKMTSDAISRVFSHLSPSLPSGTRLHFGLAVSREVINEMGGRMELEAQEPQGVTFRVVLPGFTRVSYPAPPPRPPVRVSPERASVVIVDDEPMMCELFAAMLSDSYDVAAFSSSRAALASMLEVDFQVVLCDVMMPELNGMDLFDRVTSERPELRDRFVFITGGAFTEHARLFLRQTGRPVVRKPCTRQELRDAVERILTCTT